MSTDSDARATRDLIGEDSRRVAGGRSRVTGLALALVAGALVLADARAARAFTIDSVATKGCHELITSDAFRAVRSRLTTAAPLPATRDERALIDDLPFSRPSDMNDLGAATLLMGVRDNDLAGRDANDLSQLALVHGDPLLQQRHCLHDAHEAEPGGSQMALLECRAFILERVDQALDGLDAAGAPDPSLRTSLQVFLALRRRVDAPLPTYYVRIGQAVHALEDSFSHTYRTPDGVGVTAVVNWIDQVDNDLNEAVDGPPHSFELDRCDDRDELRRARRLSATAAATALFQVTLDPTQTRAQKMAGVSALLDETLGYVPGCTAENGWCAAPERKYRLVDDVFRCDVAGTAGAHWGAVVALALLALLAVVRRRRATALIAGVVMLVFSGRALADAPAPDAGAAAAAHVPPPVTSPVPEPGPVDRSRPAFGMYLGGAGSATDAALAAALGARLRATLHWTFGLDVEWNPWIAINGESKFRAGALNFYGTAIFRVPLAYQRFNLRVTASFGGSRTLIDLYGVPKGSTGIFAALSPLGLEWKASRLFYVVINPLGIAIPVPQLDGIPFWYPQYRASIGFEIYAR